MKVYSTLHGEFRLACERGAVRFDVVMSPVAPPRIQDVSWTEEIADNARTQKAAIALAAAIGDRNVDRAADLFASGVDLVRARKTLAHLGIDHGTCSVEHGHLEIEHGAFEHKLRPRYSLRCSGKPIDLTFSLDDKTDRISTFSANPPRAFDATCWD